MKSIVCTLATQAGIFPAGTTASVYRFEITGAQNSFQDVAYGTAPVTTEFSDVKAGDYTVTAELLDGNGVRVGNLVSATVTVPEADVTLIVPAGLTVEVLTR